MTDIVNIICQVGMLVCGGSAIFFVSMKNRYMKWGYIFGLIGQPFWLIMAIKTEQWGMLILVIFYTLNWIKGIYNYWFKKDNKQHGLH